jgi:hypothetical protein
MIGKLVALVFLFQLSFTGVLGLQLPPAHHDTQHVGCPFLMVDSVCISPLAALHIDVLAFVFIFFAIGVCFLYIQLGQKDNHIDIRALLFRQRWRYFRVSTVFDHLLSNGIMHSRRF